MSNDKTSDEKTSDKAAHYEKLAFNFCKAATIILLTGKFALPFASGAAAVLFFLAHRNGARATRCILGKPLVVASFWAVVCVASLFFIMRPMLAH